MLLHGALAIVCRMARTPWSELLRRTERAAHSGQVVVGSTRGSEGRFCASEVLHYHSGAPRARRSDHPSRRSNPPSLARVIWPVGAPAASGLPRAAGALAAAVSARSIRVLTGSIGSRRSRCSSALRFRASGPLLKALCVGLHSNTVSVSNKVEEEVEHLLLVPPVPYSTRRKRAAHAWTLAHRWTRRSTERRRHK